MEEVLTKLSWDVINDYLERDLLIIQKHPTKDLWILNYSKTCQYSRAWDLVTLSCRGLVVNGAGTIVARSFKKFFNKEEYEAYEDLPNIPTNESFEVFEKMDGSLISIFHYENEWIIASRGSFMSDQALWGKELVSNEMLNNYDINYTYIHELIVKQNRIVVNYGDRNELVLLTAINNENNNELSYDNLLKLNSFVTIVTRYDGLKDFDKMKALNTDNKEGFVILFANGFRMKVKFDTYIKLHQVTTNTSSKDIWRCLRDNISLDEIIKVIPDEMFQWLKKWEKTIKEDYKIIEEINIENFNEIMEEFKLKNIVPTKKDFALANLSIKKGNSSIRFKMFENKSYNNIIWKLIEPTYEKMSFY